jgi:hypothetical protein
LISADERFKTSQLPNPNFIMFSERNSEALDAAVNSDYGSVNQDDPPQ